MTPLTPDLPLPLSAISTLAAPVDHVEAVAVAPDGSIWGGGEAGQLYRIDPGGSFEQVADTGAGAFLGLAFDARGRVYVCAPEAHAVLRYDPASGSLEAYVPAAGGAALRIPNFCTFQADGSLLISDSGSEHVPERAGSIVSAPRGGGEAEILAVPPLHFPNGIALAPDGRLAILESFTPKLSLLDLATGSLELIAELPCTVPDGIAYDAEGGAIVSCYQPNRIMRVLPSGASSTVVDDWMGIDLLSPTNVAFYGAERRRLAIASLLGTMVYSLDLPWAGSPLEYPDVA
jgi:gluconolactonase